MRHACWCVKVSGLLRLNVWLLKEHLDWILDFLHFQYFDQAGSILDWVWHSLCVGYLINPLYISLSRHGDLISPRLVILFSEQGDLKNSIQVMLFSQHGEHIKSRLAVSFSTHEARIKPRLVMSFSRQGDLWKSKAGNVIFQTWRQYQSLRGYLFAKFGKLKYPRLDVMSILSWILWFSCSSSPGYRYAPGLEFVLTHSGYFLMNQTWRNCTFSKFGFYLRPGNFQVKTK